MFDKSHEFRYELQNDKLPYNSSHRIMVDLVGSNKIVLEIGTSTGYISKKLKEHKNITIGVEIDQDASNVAKQYCDQIINADIETMILETFFRTESFDVILCGDVLEHLKKPKHLLLNLKKFLKPGGYLVVSIPNFCHGDVILNILLGNFQYTPIGLLDETHVKFFALKNIYKMFDECGYEIRNLETVSAEIGETELGIDEKKLSPILLKIIRSLPNSNVYQFVFTAHPSIEINTPIFKDPDLKTIEENSLDEYHQEKIFAFAQLIEKYVSIEEELTRKNEYILYLEEKLKEKHIFIRFLKKLVRTLIKISPEGTKRRTMIDYANKVGGLFFDNGFKKTIINLKKGLQLWFIRKHE